MTSVAPALANVAVRLVVQVPFTAADFPALERSHAIWSSIKPCHEGKWSAQAGLLYIYNHACSGDDNSCARAMRLVEQHTTIRKCFDQVDVRGANLSGKQDEYDKKRQRASWSKGPNSMFRFAVSQARSLGYTHMLQLEADVLPMRSAWLEHVHGIATVSDAWIIGSALQANCTREETDGQCRPDLPDDIAEHINGNALYAVADEGFYNYLQASTRGHLGKMPFDLALHLLRQRLDQPARRQILHKFQHSSFILNMGTSSPDIMRLMLQYPSAVLVHSSAFSKMNMSTLSSLFLGTISGSAVLNSRDTDVHQTPLDLTVLFEAAGPSHAVVAAFVAGKLYHGLCRNYAHHLRLAKVSHHVFIALEEATSTWLQQQNFGPVLDASGLVAIPKDGSDTFGSAAFFAINGARYRVLLSILRAGISLFVLDLDVVLLRDPLRWVEEHSSGDAAKVDLFLQSDARDGLSGKETDPDLLQHRLKLHGKRSWTYVNGGVFFCRARPSSIALFTRVWDTLSRSSKAPNEQDLLNQELSVDRTLVWDVLPSRFFPNGFVYFNRPVPDLAEPVLIHVNWVSGVQEKVYHMQEAGLWALNESNPLCEGQLLAVGESIDQGPEGPMGIAAHRRALRDALVIARVLNRSLVLPRFPVSIEAAAGGRRATVSHYFDYTVLTRHHRHICTADSLTRYSQSKRCKIHIDIKRGDEPSLTDGYTVIRASNGLGLSPKTMLENFALCSSVPVMELSTTYRRAELDANDAFGLQPASRLRNLARFVRSEIKKSRKRFDCIDVSTSKEFAAMLEYSNGRALNQSTHSAPSQHITSTVLIRGALRTLRNSRRQIFLMGANKSFILRESESLLQRKHVFQLEDVVPDWYRVDYDTAQSTNTLARSYVELLVCAHSERFVGNLAAPSTHAACALRLKIFNTQDSGAGLDAYKHSERHCKDAIGRRLRMQGWNFY